MRITAKQIKKIIKEEIVKVMRETQGGSNVNFWNIDEAESGEQNILPLQYGENLITNYSLKLSETLASDFEMDQETIELLITKLPSGDDIEQLFDGTEQAAANVELLKSFDENFVGYPIGELRISDHSDSGVKVIFNGKTLEFFDPESLKEKLDKEETLEINLGYGMPSPKFIGGIIANEVSGIGEDADVDDADSGYVRGFDPGVADGESGMDYPTTANIRILKVLEDINNGTLAIELGQDFEDEADSIYYKLR